MRLVMEAFGEALLDRTLLRFADRADNMAPVLRAIADDFYDIEAAQFATEGGRSGGWEPLKASTLADKQRKGYGSRGILERTLDLEESLTGRTGRFSIYRVTADELEVGTSDPKAKYHHSKLPRRSNLPRRPLIELTEADKRGMMKRIQRYLVDGTVQSADFVVGL